MSESLETSSVLYSELSQQELEKEFYLPISLTANLEGDLTDISYSYLKSIWVNSDRSLEASLINFIQTESIKFWIDFAQVDKLNLDFKRGEVIFIFKEWILFDWKDDFRIKIKDYVDWELVKVEEKKRLSEKECGETMELFSSGLDAIDDLFSWERFVEGEERFSWDYYVERFRWKNIKEVWYIVRADFHKLEKLINGYGFSFWWSRDSMYRTYFYRLLELKERYLYMFMWIWDKYEDGATVFTRNESEVRTIIVDIVGSKKTNREVFDFMIKLHWDIDENDAQDAIIKEAEKWAYPRLIKILNETVLARLKESNAPDEDFLNYAKIVTWRDVTFSLENWEQEEIDVNTDYDLNSSEDANEALMFVMFRKWWLYDKLNWNNESDFREENWVLIYPEKFPIIDEEIWNQTPAEVIEEFKLVFNTRVLNDSWNTISLPNDFVEELFWKSLWWAWWMNDILKNPELSWDYQKLSIYQKIKISTIKRLTTELQNYHIRIPLIGYDLDTWVESSFRTMQYAELFAAISSVEKEASSAVLDWFWRHFDWKGKNTREYLKYLWIKNGREEFSETELDIFELYNDVNGNWDWYELSDDTLSFWVTLWWFAGVIALSILLTMATAWWASVFWATALASALSTNVLLQWTVAWIYGSVSSWAIFPQWYSSKEKMIEDLLSDLAIWWWTWALWWWRARGWTWTFLSRFRWDPNANLLSNTWWAWKNKMIFAWDLTVLWIWAELYRNSMVQWDYAWDWTLFDWEFVEREWFDSIWQLWEREVENNDWTVTYEGWIQVRKTDTWYEIKSWEDIVYIYLWKDWNIKGMSMWERNFLIPYTDNYIFFSRLEGRVVFTKDQLKICWDTDWHKVTIKDMIELLKTDRNGFFRLWNMDIQETRLPMFDDMMKRNY